MLALRPISVLVSLGVSAPLLALSGCGEQSEEPAAPEAAIPTTPPAAPVSSSPPAQPETPAPPSSASPVMPPPALPPATGGGVLPPTESGGQPGAPMQPEPPAMPPGGAGGAPAQPGSEPPAGGVGGVGGAPGQNTGGVAPIPPVAGAASAVTLGCTGNELLCEDFEAVAEGGLPGGAWQPLGASCEFQVGTFHMGVSAERAKGGNQSLKVTNKHFPDCRLSGQFQPVDSFWVRAYMYWEPELDISNRETLVMDLTPGHITADDPAVRFGYRSKAPCEDFAGPQVTIIGIGGGEATGCGSRELPRGQWYCFEAHVQQAAGLEVRTFVDGEAITYQSIGKPLTESVTAEGVPEKKLDHLRLGIFSTSEAQGSIFVDEVAVSEARVGCAP